MKAIISDIHSNLEALKAVLDDIESRASTRFIAWATSSATARTRASASTWSWIARWCLLGNHDQGAMFDPDGFNRAAEMAIFWTRRSSKLPSEIRDPDREKRWEFLAERPRIHRENGYLFVHGSARNPLNEYVFPEDIYNQRKMERIFTSGRALLLPGAHARPGHLHRETCSSLRPTTSNYAYKLDGRKTLCNVGSVGQPRDLDPRACYVMLDDDTIRFRRVAYDVGTTKKKIYAIPELENFLGDRLREGR